MRRLTLAEAYALQQQPTPALVALLEDDGVTSSSIAEVLGWDELQLDRFMASSPTKATFRQQRHEPIRNVPDPSLDSHRGSTHDSLASVTSLEHSTTASLITSPSVSTIASTGTSSAPAHRQVVLTTGHRGDRAIENEIATVRETIPGNLHWFIERSQLKLADLKDLLDELQPTILHLTAHSDGTAGLELHDGRDRAIVSWSEFLGEFAKSVHRPDLVVLNVCHSSGQASAFLALGVRAVITVVGEVGLEAARAFMGEFYRSLATYELGRAKERSDTSIRNIWPEAIYRLQTASPVPWFAPWNWARSTGA